MRIGEQARIMTIQKTSKTTFKSPPLTFSNWAIIGIFWIMALAMLTIAQSFFIPVLTAVLLALIFSPVRRLLGKLKIGATASAFIIFLSLLTALVLSLYFLAGPVQTRLAALPSLLPDAVAKIETLSGVMQPVIQASEQIDDIASNSGTSPDVVLRERRILSAVAETTPRVLGQIGFTLALMMFLMSSGDLFYEKLVQIMPTIKDKRRAISLVKSIEERVSTYFITITLINAVLGVCVGLALWALGMPDPILFGIAAFFLNYIPFVGAIIGVSITFLIAVLTFNSLAVAALPGFVYFSLNAIEGQIITPMLVGRRLRLNAVVVFLSVAMGAWMWSFMGMFLAIPVLIVLKALSEDIQALQRVGEFLGERTRTTRKDQTILDKAL